MSGKNVKLSSIICAVLSLLIVLSVFLPFISMRGGIRAGFGFGTNDFAGMSLVEYGMYATEIGAEDIGALVIGLTGVLAVFGLFSTLFGFFKKSIPVIVFDVLALVIFMLLRWDFIDREVVGENETFCWGIGFKLCWIAIVLSIATAIWLFINKRLAKKGK